MTSVEPFDLTNFLPDSLGLLDNAAAPIRSMFPSPYEDPYLKLMRQDPLELVGEKDFGPVREISEDVIGTPIQEFFRGANIFITGGTGFIGKILIDKLIRSIPHLGHIYLLIRSKRGNCSQERFNQLLEDQVFLRMKTEVPHYHSKISVMDGDISEPGLGLSAADHQLLTDTVHMVFHSAADVRFLEPLKTAISSNVLGSRRVMDLARDMIQLKCYVHVSTVFSHCVRRVIDEQVHKMSINYKDLLNILETMSDDQIIKLTPRLLEGWPNTYTFSKAVCEDMIQEEADGLPICIFRPSVVIPTYKEPVRGWTDNLYGPVGIMMGLGLGVIHIHKCNPELFLDVVPVDYVVNSMMAVAWKTGTIRDDNVITVYNYVLSPVKQMNWKSLIDLSNKNPTAFAYSQAIWYVSHTNVYSDWAYDLGHLLLHKIPGLMLDKTAVLSGQQPRLSKIYNKMSQLKDQMHFFLNTIWEFKNDNVMHLWNEMTERDQKEFNFDLRDVDIPELFMISRLGTRYFYLKDKMDTIPAAERRGKWLYLIHNTVKLVTGLAALKLMVCLARILPL